MKIERSETDLVDTLQILLNTAFEVICLAGTSFAGRTIFFSRASFYAGTAWLMTGT